MEFAPNHRVLIVEDDGDLREALAQILRRRGYEPIEAENGRIAIESLHEGELPAVILLDIAMPIMDGWAFRAEQQKNPRLESIPLVVFTADGDSEGIAARMRVAGFVQKSACLDAILGEVRRVCERDS